LGKGAGNTAFSLLSAIKNPKLMTLALDYSSLAVKLVQAGANSLYHDPPSGSIQAAVWNLSCAISLSPGAPAFVVLSVLHQRRSPYSQMTSPNYVHTGEATGG
ncbi:hypothetical protein F5141DRAFT_1003308, partial [Pisolithus sp. B1]